MTVRRMNPTAGMELIGDHWWHEDPCDPDWLMLGFAPMPRTMWQAFRYHVLHGLLMGYRPARVLRWSWRNRRSFYPEVYPDMQVPSRAERIALMGGDQADV